MAKTRQRARAERERLAAIAAAERQAVAERAARMRQRRARLARILDTVGIRRGSSGRGRPGGVLAARRARTARMTWAGLVAIVVVVWLITHNLAAVALTVVAGALVAPVVYTLISRKD